MIYISDKMPNIIERKHFKVVKFGTSGHIIFPKEYIGKKVLCVFKSDVSKEDYDALYS